MPRVNKRSTIYDVASDAGVSITTVSRYLNNSQSVKDETASRIAEVMERLDYVPHGNTGSRATREVGRIGILTPFFPAPSFVERLEGLIPVLRKNNLEAVVYTIEGPDQLDEYLRSVPFTRRIDGLVLMSVLLTEEQHRILDAADLNVVIVETDDEKYSRVLADDERGGRLAAELFLDRNYLPCVYLADQNRDLSYSLHPSDVRQKGFEAALAESGRPLDPKNVIESQTSVESAARIFETYLEKHPVPRGLFAMSDVQAIGVLKVARRKGIRVPEDMAVLGFDDIEAADWMELSTITQHLGDSGRVAGDLLLDRIRGKSRVIQKVNLQVGLVERSTT